MIEPLAILTYLFAHHVSNASANTFTISSPSFANHGTIPRSYGCGGKNLTPPLKWSGAPKQTQSFVLLIMDQDVPRSQWYQWAVYNIPPQQHYLPKNAPAQQTAAITSNSWGIVDYRSTCKMNKTHHYKIDLYALDTKLSQSATLDPVTLRKKMQSHILGIAELYGHTHKKSQGFN